MAMEAQELLEEEVETFDIWWRSLETVSTISSLRSKVETIREQELEKALSRLGSEFAEKHQEVIEALTRGIVNKILHDPMHQGILVSDGLFIDQVFSRAELPEILGCFGTVLTVQLQLDPSNVASVFVVSDANV